jgi:hypothetical protein
MFREGNTAKAQKWRPLDVFAPVLLSARVRKEYVIRPVVLETGRPIELWRKVHGARNKRCSRAVYIPVWNAVRLIR